MGRITLVTGGARSGKSSYALKLAQALSPPRYFIATCPRIDPELEGRIRRHREERRHQGWHTVEEERDLAKVVQKITSGVVVVDCLTLWVNNLFFAAPDISEETISRHTADLLERCSHKDVTYLFVTNEVGWSIVPENSQARRYRDLVGRCNQVMADAAHRVVLVACGQPLTIKNVEP